MGELSADDHLDRELVTRYLGGDAGAMDDLLGRHMGLIGRIAGEYVTSHFPHEDCMQEGVSGFIQGVKRFKVDKPNKLSTYVGIWIRRELYRAKVRSRVVCLKEWVYGFATTDEPGRLEGLSERKRTSVEFAKAALAGNPDVDSLELSKATEAAEFDGEELAVFREELAGLTERQRLQVLHVTKVRTGVGRLNLTRAEIADAPRVHAAFAATLARRLGRDIP